MDEFLKTIKSNLAESFIQIPNTMAKIFNKNVLSKFKTEEEKVGDQNEIDDLIEESVDSIFSSSSNSDSEQNKIEKIKKKVKEKKVAIDLVTGKEAEKLFANRVDRDIFDLKYHGKFQFSQTYEFTKLNETLPLNNIPLQNFSKYISEVNDVTKFLKPLKIKLDGEIDFIIPNVNKNDITKILDDESKKRCVFLDKDLFKENNYDIYVEATVNLFNPSIYIHKFRQILRYILLIKLIENNTDYFKSKNISTNKKAIMIVTDGNYGDFINKLSESKIFSKDFEEKEFISNSINQIINCKKFEEELDDFETQINNIKDSKSKCNKIISSYKGNDINKLNDEYYKEKNLYISYENSLKERTKNLLKLLKASEIPFILCYFPKVGGEFPFDLFKNKTIVLKKNKTKDNSYQYQFEIIDEKSYISKTDFETILKKDYISKTEMEKDYISKTDFEKTKTELEITKTELEITKTELEKTKKEFEKMQAKLSYLEDMMKNNQK